MDQLFQAVAMGSAPAVLALLQARADPNDAMRVAADNPSMVQLLLDARADPTARFGEPLVNAIKAGCTESVRILLNAGADPSEGLYNASGTASVDIVQILIDAGACVTRGDNIAIQHAACGKNIAHMKLLIKHGADVTADNNSAVCHAIKVMDFYVVKLLLEHGADPSVNDHTPVKQIFKYGHGRMLTLLINHMHFHPEYRYAYDTNKGSLYIFTLVSGEIWCSGEADNAFIEAILPTLIRKKSAA
jgi:ankyrin repeat protein